MGRDPAPVEIGQRAQGIPVTVNLIAAPRKIGADHPTVFFVILTSNRCNAVQLLAEIEYVVVDLTSVVLPAMDKSDDQGVMVGAPVGVVDGVEHFRELPRVPCIA